MTMADYGNTVYEMANEIFDEVVFEDSRDLDLYNDNDDSYASLRDDLYDIVGEMMHAAEEAMMRVANERKDAFLNNVRSHPKGYIVYAGLTGDYGCGMWNALYDFTSIFPSQVFDSERDAQRAVNLLMRVNKSAIMPYVRARHPECDEVDVEYSVAPTSENCPWIDAYIDETLYIKED